MVSGKHRLTALKVEKAKKHGYLSDGHGLYLKIRKGGSKTWAYIWTKDKKRTEISLGSAAGAQQLSLAHTRKENGAKITADSARGGGALIGAVRDCRTLNRMDDKEAQKLGVDNPRGYFKVQSDKGNFAPPESAHWYKFEGVELNNDTKSRAGDNVGAVKRWYPKDPLDEVSEDMILQIISRIAQGDCKFSSQADDWAGHSIADILGRNTKDQKDKAFVNRVLNTLLQSGRITKIKKVDHTRKARPYYSVPESIAS